MAEDILSDRKRAMEEEFFRKRERELLERMKAERTRQTAKQALAAASGVQDEATLDHLLGLGLDPDAVLALRLVPLVEVAWADGHLDARERQAVLSALEHEGIAPGSTPHVLIQGWLDEPPPPAMLEAWTTYTTALSARLTEPERAALRAAVLGRARAVAEAAGGFLGLGKVSAAEQEVLRRLDRAFAAGPA
jgi:hypothetical protein